MAKRKDAGQSSSEFASLSDADLAQMQRTNRARATPKMAQRYAAVTAEVEKRTKAGAYSPPAPKSAPAPAAKPMPSVEDVRRAESIARGERLVGDVLGRDADTINIRSKQDYADARRTLLEMAKDSPKSSRYSGDRLDIQNALSEVRKQGNEIRSFEARQGSLFGSGMKQGDLVDAVKATAPKADPKRAAFGTEGYEAPGSRGKNEAYWERRAERAPTVDELPPGAFKGTQKEFSSLSPGMRREIERTALKAKAPSPSEVVKEAYRLGGAETNPKASPVSYQEAEASMKANPGWSDAARARSAEERAADAKSAVKAVSGDDGKSPAQKAMAESTEAKPTKSKVSAQRQAAMDDYKRVSGLTPRPNMTIKELNSATKRYAIQNANDKIKGATAARELLGPSADRPPTVATDPAKPSAAVEAARKGDVKALAAALRSNPTNAAAVMKNFKAGKTSEAGLQKLEAKVNPSAPKPSAPAPEAKPAATQTKAPSKAASIKAAKADLAKIEEGARNRSVSDDAYARTGQMAADNKAIADAQAKVRSLEGPKKASKTPALAMVQNKEGLYYRDLGQGKSEWTASRGNASVLSRDQAKAIGGKVLPYSTDGKPAAPKASGKGRMAEMTGKNYPGIPESSKLGQALRGPKGVEVAKAVDDLRNEIGKAKGERHAWDDAAREAAAKAQGHALPGEGKPKAPSAKRQAAIDAYTKEYGKAPPASMSIKAMNEKAGSLARMKVHDKGKVAAIPELWKAPAPAAKPQSTALVPIRPTPLVPVQSQAPAMAPKPSLGQRAGQAYNTFNRVGMPIATATAAAQAFQQSKAAGGSNLEAVGSATLAAAPGAALMAAPAGARALQSTGTVAGRMGAAALSVAGKVALPAFAAYGAYQGYKQDGARGAVRGVIGTLDPTGIVTNVGAATGLMSDPRSLGERAFDAAFGKAGEGKKGQQASTFEKANASFEAQRAGKAASAEESGEGNAGWSDKARASAYATRMQNLGKAPENVPHELTNWSPDAKTKG